MGLITKVADGNFLIDRMTYGGSRAAKLSPKEKKYLRKHYGLSDDADLGLRNAGRGVAGALIGGAVGTTAGVGFNKLLERINKVKSPVGRLLGASGGGFVGSLAGEILATNKYSKSNYDKLVKKAYIDPVTAAIVGAIRTSNLTDKDKEKLRKRYHLDKDDNPMVRNIGRGIAGGTLGAAAGGALGILAGDPRLGPLLTLAGGAAGTQLATNKYSKSNVKK